MNADRVEKLRNYRGRGTDAFTRYCEDKNKYPDNLFCFLEGEDMKYYGTRIEKYADYGFEKTRSYKCGGKNEVLRALRFVRNNYDVDDGKMNKAFFVDRDYGTRGVTDKLLYQTPCYSIENLYTSRDAFSRILIREFGINAGEGDYVRCCDDYERRRAEFHNATLSLNAWLSCQRIYEDGETGEKGSGGSEKRFNAGDVKLGRFFSEVTIERVEVKEEISLAMLEAMYPDSREVSENDLEREMERLRGCDMGMAFRGKFELWFLQKIIESLKGDRGREYFEGEYTSVKIDPTNNAISALQSYADTPDSLVEFLSGYRRDQVI